MGSFICIDLKSFYASAECVARGYDPLNTNLVVADLSRTDKTICLAVSPSLKAIGVPGRPRLFEVVKIVNDYNKQRLRKTQYGMFMQKTIYASEINSETELDYVVAPPRMARYMEVSSQIYNIYMRYVSPDDIHVYSIDEVFMDVTGYLEIYHCTAHELAMRMIRDVLKETGITATAGVGSNMYLAKIAMDIVAKKMPADKDGVRIAELDEISYREKLWEHTPITDFWRIGKGTARKLADNHMFTMGDIALESEYNEDKLYKLFGKNAELIIDHAWGYEPCTMEAIKKYESKNHSICSGQVLTRPYNVKEARIVIHEMADQLAFDLFRKGMVCDQIKVDVCYDHESDTSKYDGPMCKNQYGKVVPKPVNASFNLDRQTSSTKLIINAALTIFDRIVDKTLLVRRLNITANHVIPENEAKTEVYTQFSLFDDVEEVTKKQDAENAALEKEKKINQALASIKEKYGKNAIMKAMNYQEGATAIERNGQVGGHNA